MENGLCGNQEFEIWGRGTGWNGWSGVVPGFALRLFRHIGRAFDATRDAEFQMGKYGGAKAGVVLAEGKECGAMANGVRCIGHRSVLRGLMQRAAFFAMERWMRAGGAQGRLALYDGRPSAGFLRSWLMLSGGVGKNLCRGSAALLCLAVVRVWGGLYLRPGLP